MSVVIRPEQLGDQAAVRAINEAAFPGSDEAQLVDDLRTSDAWIDGGSLVAEDGHALIGHVLLTLGRLDLEGGGSRPIWMVGPVAVVPDRQRQGIGAALMHAAISLAIEHEQPVLCLLGHADYYPRFGFEPARAIGMEPPRPWRDASWMALRLPAWTPELRGIARFASAFPDAQ